MPRSTFQPRDRELISAPNFCHVAVPAEDGTIQTVVVWVDLDGDQIVLNSAEGRDWPANLRRAGRATLTVMNLDNPQEFVTVVARVVEDTHDGADGVIDALSHKYDGRDYDFTPGQQRVTFRLEPERVVRHSDQLRIDHVIWKVADLDRGAAHIADTFGLSDGGGGRHVGIGTHNRVFPLGGGYLEVLAVADPQEAARSPLGQAIVDAPEGLFGWAVAVDDVDAHAARLSLEVMTIAREDLTARLAGVAEAMRDRWLPFFIQRDAGVADPGASGDAGGITALEVAADAERLERWLDGADMPLRLADDDGPRGLRALVLGSGLVIS